MCDVLGHTENSPVLAFDQFHLNTFLFDRREARGHTDPFEVPCHCKFFYQACDAASSIKAATSFGLEE